MNGLRSLTSSTKAQMFPHVTAAFCLSSFVRSRRPRMMMGRTTASEGASIELTNVVSMSLSRHVSVSFCGWRMASMTRWSIPSTSAFFTQRQMGSMTCPASADTFGCVSKTHSKNAGKISGIVRMKYCGTRCARSPQVPRAPHFACQLLCSIAATSEGERSFIAVSGRDLTSAVCPTSAAALTSDDWSPCRANTCDARWTAKGSNALPAVRHMWVYSAHPPALATTSFFAASAASMRGTTPNLLMDDPPMPLQSPATPAAPARRSFSAAEVVASAMSFSMRAVAAAPRSAASGATAGAATKQPWSPSDFSDLRMSSSAADLSASPDGREVAAQWP